MKNYYVTDAGGARPDIAGKRRRVGEAIRLTDTEAQFELSRGMIETNEQREARLAREREATAPAPKPKAKG
jgi:hypothetical protein